MPLHILVIRRDNIGDLVCTTPLFSALRRHFPEARIAALVNSYNAPVLDGNPDVDEVHVYRKAKHRDASESRIAIWWETWQLMCRLRKKKYDIAIVATPARHVGALRFAHWTNAKRVIAYGEGTDGIDDPIPLAHTNTGHETEAVMGLLSPLGIDEAPGLTRVMAHAKQVETIAVPSGEGPLVALHISARKPAQRWPIERFSALAHALHARHRARFLLFWSPGDANHAQHPGDDDKAEQLIASCQDLPLFACSTYRLEELIAGLARCDRVICSDGGAMHLAAGLGKPIICFFGNSDAERWHPWGVVHELLQHPSRKVLDISVSDVLSAFANLDQRIIEGRSVSRDGP